MSENDPESVVGRDTSNLTAASAVGLKWTYGATAAGALMQLAYTAVMARLLDPEAFGLLTIGQLVINFGFYFSQMGIGQALIQREEVSTDHIRASFTSSVLLGVTATGVCWMVAPLIGALFNTPEATAIVRAFGFMFLLRGLGQTASNLLRRQMRFRELELTRTAAFFLGYLVIGIGLGLAGAGVWSLVAAVVAAQGMGAALAYGCSRHPLRPILRWEAYRPLLAYGSRFSLSNFLDFLSTNLDTFAVGRYASTASLGLYNRAFYLVQLPLSQLLHGLSRVLLPGFSRIQADLERLRATYLGVVSVGATLLVPICAGVAVAAPELVLTVLGDQWTAAVPVVPILAAAVAFSVLSRFAGIVFDATDALKQKLLLQLISLALLAALLGLAIGRGLWAFAAALALAEAGRHALFIGLLRRVISLRARDIAAAYLPAMAAAAVVAGTIAAVRIGVTAVALPVVVALLAEIAAGAVGLLLALRLPPSAGVRRELRYRLFRAGWLGAPEGRRARAVDRVLGHDG